MLRNAGLKPILSQKSNQTGPQSTYTGPQRPILFPMWPASCPPLLYIELSIPFCDVTSIFCSSFDLERDAYDSDEDIDEEKPYNSKMDEAKILEDNNKPGGGSRLPIRNVLDVFQELKLAFGRSWTNLSAN